MTGTCKLGRRESSSPLRDLLDQASANCCLLLPTCTAEDSMAVCKVAGNHLEERDQQRVPKMHEYCTKVPQAMYASTRVYCSHQFQSFTVTVKYVSARDSSKENLCSL